MRPIAWFTCEACELVVGHPARLGWDNCGMPQAQIDGAPPVCPTCGGQTAFEKFTYPEIGRFAD